MRLIFFLSLLLGACGYQNTKPPNLISGENRNYNIDGSIGLDYKTIRAKVLEPYCFECHSNEGGNEGEVNMETYASTFVNISTIQNEILAGSMPKKRPPLSPDIKQILLNWIDAGAPEFSDSTKDNNTKPPQPNPENPPSDSGPKPCEDHHHDDDHLDYPHLLNEKINRRDKEDECKVRKNQL